MRGGKSKFIMRAKKRFFPREHKIVLAVVFVIFLLYAASLLYPLIWVFTNSFRTDINFYFYPLRSIFHAEEIFTFENYGKIFSIYNVGSMFLNSIIIAVGATVASVVVSAMSAYVVNKYKFIGKNLIYTVSILIMIIPTTGSIATTYKLMNDTHLAGSHIGLIIMASGGLGFNFFMIYSAYSNLSWTYAESAMLDGAGHAQIFFRIMLPLIKPVLFSVGIIMFIGQWNDYFSPYLYLREHPTLAVGIYLTTENITHDTDTYYPTLFALMAVATIPIIVVFGIFQKTIMENTIAGGIKG